MDADEALARLLQEEELRAAGAVQGLQLASTARQAIAGGGPAAGGTESFGSRLRMLQEIALRCESPQLQERARGVMPLARLRAAAAESAALAGRLGSDVAAPAAEDELAKGLLAWFKTEFFTWVDTLPCASCGCASTSHGGGAQPLPDELAGGAGRVELHVCGRCGAATRFPRFNDPARLLQPGCRRGRCGEWANAFLLCCRAAGLTARYVSDWADHVWTEYYSHRHRRWIHMDSCEAAYDTPLLYESGWGKEVLYVVAAGVWGLVDVTPRYTARWRQHALTGRRLVSERWLAGELDAMTEARRRGWPAPRRLVWLGRDAEERVELLRRRLGLPAAGAGSGSGSQALPGRTTGSLEWRQQRGETGAASSSSSAGAAAAAGPPGPPARPPTTFRLAPDGPGRLPPVFGCAGRLSGGAVRAAGHNEVHEVVERLFDGRVSTKWLDFGGAGLGGSSWVEYRLPNDMPPVVVRSYELLSANDCPERDPAEWRLEGVTERDWQQGRHEQWTRLDVRSGVRFPGRHSALAFTLPGPSPPCRVLRLAVTATADPRAANSVQLACWSLYGAAAATAGGGGGSGAAVGDAGGGAACAGGNGDADAAVLQRLRGAVAAAASCEATAAAVSLLGRLLGNVRREPNDPRFRKVREAKVQAILQGQLAEVLLSYVGFRPIIMPCAEGPAETGRIGVPAGEDVFLLLAADADGAELARIDKVLALLPQ